MLFNLIDWRCRPTRPAWSPSFIRGMDDKPPIEGVTEGHHGLTHHGRNPAKIEQLRIVERAGNDRVPRFPGFAAQHARKAAKACWTARKC